jgi:hypothetical protein
MMLTAAPLHLDSEVDSGKIETGTYGRCELQAAKSRAI